MRKTWVAWFGSYDEHGVKPGNTFLREKPIGYHCGKRLWAWVFDADLGTAHQFKTKKAANSAAREVYGYMHPKLCVSFIDPATGKPHVGNVESGGAL